MKILIRLITLSLFVICLGLGVYFVLTYLKPQNALYEAQTRSSSVSPRLQGIFKGMNDGFSR